MVLLHALQRHFLALDAAQAVAACRVKFRKLLWILRTTDFKFPRMMSGGKQQIKKMDQHEWVMLSRLSRHEQPKQVS